MPNKLNIPFMTVPKIKKLCKGYSDLVKQEKGKVNPDSISAGSSVQSLLHSELTLPEIKNFLKLADEVLTDLKKTNDPSNPFIRRGIRKKNFLKNKEDKFPLNSEGQVDDKEVLNDLAELGDHLMKLDFREKDEKDKSSLKGES
jgi:hypothetical protein